MRDPGPATARTFSPGGTGSAFGFGPLRFLCPGAGPSARSQGRPPLAGWPVPRMVLAGPLPCARQQSTAACPVSRASLGSRCRFGGLASPFPGQPLCQAPGGCLGGQPGSATAPTAPRSDLVQVPAAGLRCPVPYARPPAQPLLGPGSPPRPRTRSSHCASTRGGRGPSSASPAPRGRALPGHGAGDPALHDDTPPPPRARRGRGAPVGAAAGVEGGAGHLARLGVPVAGGAGRGSAPGAARAPPAECGAPSARESRG